MASVSESRRTEYHLVNLGYAVYMIKENGGGEIILGVFRDADEASVSQGRHTHPKDA